MTQLNVRLSKCAVAGNFNWDTLLTFAVTGLLCLKTFTNRMADWCHHPLQFLHGSEVEGTDILPIPATYGNCKSKASHHHKDFWRELILRAGTSRILCRCSSDFTSQYSPKSSLGLEQRRESNPKPFSPDSDAVNL